MEKMMFDPIIDLFDAYNGEIDTCNNVPKIADCRWLKIEVWKSKCQNELYTQVVVNWSENLKILLTIKIAYEIWMLNFIKRIFKRQF